MQRILVLGTDQFDHQDESSLVRSGGWIGISDTVNVKDFDHVVISIDLKQLRSLGFDGFKRFLDDANCSHLLRSGGEVYVVGDPRFDITAGVPFLWWTS